MADPRQISIIRWGMISGLGVCVAYPLVLFAPLPARAQVILAASMGPLLGFASLGLREFFQLDRRRATADAAAMCNALAGALLTAMVLVQLSASIREGHKPGADVVSVWLGLDVAWDVYVGLGTLLFALGALRHPRLGNLVGGAGIAIAIALLGLNLYTFPTPPAEAGLIDVGPLVGLWYFVVTILVLASSRWTRSTTPA